MRWLILGLVLLGCAEFPGEDDANVDPVDGGVSDAGDSETDGPLSDAAPDLRRPDTQPRDMALFDASIAGPAAAGHATGRPRSRHRP